MTPAMTGQIRHAYPLQGRNFSRKKRRIITSRTLRHPRIEGYAQQGRARMHFLTRLCYVKSEKTKPNEHTS